MSSGCFSHFTASRNLLNILGEVSIPGKVVMVSAGDSHSAALTDEGKVYYWGTFRDNSGTFGLTADGKNHSTPIPLAHHLQVKKIVSGKSVWVKFSVKFSYPNCSKSRRKPHCAAYWKGAPVFLGMCRARTFRTNWWALCKPGRTPGPRPLANARWGSRQKQACSIRGCLVRYSLSLNLEFSSEISLK